MKIYLLKSDNTKLWHYESAVVVAESAAEARKILPRADMTEADVMWEWQRPEGVHATYLGKASGALQAGSVLCASLVYKAEEQMGA